MTNETQTAGKTKVAQPRDKEGRYFFDRMDLVCRCGHRLGAHSAGQAATCIVHDFDDVPVCDCPKFRPAKAGKGGR